MPGLLEDNGPSFLSSETADAALSEVRKTQLRLNALDALNALLDELLFNILKNASSLSTDRLRASLLGLLPTSLGKEALLDAQVELRTYYAQMGTNAVLPQDDDSKTFNLQYAFELLRLKCAAYSTLNGADEDTKAEARVMEKMRDTGAAPFSPFRIAPASLYLTAIIEAVCEHMLGNVARVAARDSSRTDATINDLFIALCEDEAIYGSFKSMNVYERIEQLSNASQQQMQRGKSFRRGSKHSMSRLPSAHHDLAATMMSSPNSSYTRVSAETLTTQVGTASGHGSQPSSAGGGKKFINNGPSHDSFSIVAHKRAQSDSSKTTSSALDDHTYEDAEALQEFDDLMRSSSTMKVSLTPDRLKTMEAYKHEKDQKAQRPPFGTRIQFDTAAITRRASTREVHSIVEDEEESSFSKQPPPRHRQGTGTSPPSPSLISASSRIRSVSMSSPGSRAFGKKVVRNVPPPVSSTHLFQNSFPPPPSPNMLSPPEPNTFPPRTRKIQRNLETMDIDDVMNGSDEEQSDPPPRVPAKAPATLRSPNHPGRSGLSASTRDLIDFLAEGPPESHRNGDVLDSPNGSFTADNGKKNPGRLQRMISKLNLGGSEKGPMKHSPPPQPLGSKGSNGALSSLANKPVPPRYPRPPSPPPSSPSSTEEPTMLQAKLLNGRDRDTLLARSPKAPQSPSTSVVNPKRGEDGASKHQGHETNGKETISNSANHRSPASAEKGHPKSPAVTRSLSCRKPVPLLEPLAPPPAELVASPVSPTSRRLPDPDVREMHRLMSQATSADECRLILDMFLAKSGIQMDRAKTPRTVPFASSFSPLDAPLENAVVELLLGGEVPTEALTSPRKLRTKRHKKGLTLRPHTTDGSSPQGSPVASAFPIAAAS